MQRLMQVALRKESVDRNNHHLAVDLVESSSLSARRAWIEMSGASHRAAPHAVALRKESVDRNPMSVFRLQHFCWSLSARRAWIEIENTPRALCIVGRRSPQGERG